MQHSKLFFFLPFFLILLFLAPACVVKVNSHGNAWLGEGYRYAADEEQEFIVFLHPVRADMPEEPTEAEAQLLEQHFEYLEGLIRKGTALLAGPSTDPPYTGIVILRAPNRAAAQKIVDRDPAVAGGVFSARLSGYRVSLLAGRDR